MITRMMPDTKKLRSYGQDGQLNNLLVGFKNAVLKHNTSMVMIVDGRSGMGKTTFANQIAKFLDNDYDLNKIHYNPTTFLEGADDKIGLANAKKGDCIMFDEAMLISSRSALSQINRMIIQGMSMIRSKQLFVIFCVNSIFDLDKNLAISRADLLIHVYGENLIDRGHFLAFFKAKGQPDRIKQLYISGKKGYSYKFPRSNMHGRFSKDFIVNGIEYEAQKDKGVNEFLRGLDSRATTRGNIQRDQLIWHIHNHQGMTTNEIAKVIDLSLSQIRRIIAMYQKDTQNARAK